MTFRVGHTRLRLHPLLPLLWLIAGIGGVSRVLAALCTLLLHECGHLTAAKLCGASVSEVEITPLGGVITVENPDALTVGKRFLLASFGPLFSLLGCLLSPALFASGAASFAFVAAFAKANLLLLLFKLLPVLPLDGGHMLEAMLRRFSRNGRSGGRWSAPPKLWACCSAPFPCILPSGGSWFCLPPSAACICFTCPWRMGGAARPGT